MQINDIAADQALGLEGPSVPQGSVAARLVDYCARLRARRAAIAAAPANRHPAAPMSGTAGAITG